MIFRDMAVPPFSTYLTRISIPSHLLHVSIKTSIHMKSFPRDMLLSLKCIGIFQVLKNLNGEMQR